MESQLQLIKRALHQLEVEKEGEKNKIRLIQAKFGFRFQSVHYSLVGP